MSARGWVGALALLAMVRGGAATVDTTPLIKRALERFQADGRKSADYGWTRNSKKTEFSSNGSVKSQLATVTVRERYEGFMISRLIERNGKPLDAIERDRNEAALLKHVGELKSMTPEQRDKLRADARKKEAEEDAWIAEAPVALEFKPSGDEAVAGRPAYVFDIAPRPGYRPSNMKARIFERMRGKAWIDKADTELAKCDIEIFDTVSVGFGVMARIEKGTRFLLQRSRIPDGSWMPESQRIRVDGRFLLFKSMNEEIVSSYSGWRAQ